MARWKWFQRKDEPIDVVNRPSIASSPVPTAPVELRANVPTEVQPRQRPLTRAGQERFSHAVRRCHRRSYR